jgi:hypothetical protein
MEDNLIFKEGEELSVKEVIERSFNKGALSERQRCLKMIEELRYNLKMEIQGYPFPIYNQIPIDMFIDEECDKVKQQLNQPKTEE